MSMSMYPYDFQTSGHKVVDHVRATIDSQRDWDFARSIKEARANCVAAAKRFGLKTLQADEHKALADYLIAKRAGLNIATYAWGTYVDMIATKKQDTLVSFE